MSFGCFFFFSGANRLGLFVLRLAGAVSATLQPPF